MRLCLLRLKGALLRCNVRKELMKLAREAAYHRDFRVFFRATGLAGDLSDESASTLSWMAILYCEGGQQSEAERLFAAAFEKVPDDPTLLAYYGGYLQMGQLFRESIGYLQRALTAMPHEAWIWYRLGESYRCLGEWEKARECYLSSMERDVDGSETGANNNGLAYCASQMGDWKQAAVYWQEAAARLPHEGEIWYDLGDALVHAGDYRRAIMALRKSLRLGCRRPAWALYDLASAYYHLGENRQAKRYCEQTLRRDPNDADALELKRELETQTPAKGT
jgi:tetratricopeptide (TPR) repeat protein